MYRMYHMYLMYLIIPTSCASCTSRRILARRLVLIYTSAGSIIIIIHTARRIVQPMEYGQGQRGRKLLYSTVHINL